MSSVFPQGANPGVKLNVEVLGEHMDRASTAFFLDDSIKARVLKSAHTRLELEFDELVHVYSNTARSLYSDQGGGVLGFPDATQSAIQAAVGNAAKSAALQSALAGAGGVPLRFRLQTGRIGFFYRPLADVEVDTGYWIQQKEGTRPFGMGFGSPGGNFANAAAPTSDFRSLEGRLRESRRAGSLTWFLRVISRLSKAGNNHHPWQGNRSGGCTSGSRPMADGWPGSLVPSVSTSEVQRLFQKGSDPLKSFPNRCVLLSRCSFHKGSDPFFG